MTRLHFQMMAAWACLILTGSFSMAAEQAKKPNVLIILTDDTGWEEYGFQGNKQIPTPNIDSIAKAGSMLGSGAVIVMDETRCMVKSLLRLSYFYSHESCGQCTPCREGTGWLWRLVNRIEHGQGKVDDLTLLDSVAENIMGRTICALGDAAAMPVRGMLKHFRDEFVHHVEHKTCMVPAYV